MAENEYTVPDEYDLPALGIKRSVIFRQCDLTASGSQSLLASTQQPFAYIFVGEISGVKLLVGEGFTAPEPGTVYPVQIMHNNNE